MWSQRRGDRYRDRDAATLQFAQFAEHAGVQGEGFLPLYMVQQDETPEERNGHRNSGYALSGDFGDRHRPAPPFRAR